MKLANGAFISTGAHDGGIGGPVLKTALIWLLSCCERLCAPVWKGTTSAGSAPNRLRQSRTTAAACSPRAILGASTTPQLVEALG